jgi:hypothetical protein
MTGLNNSGGYFMPKKTKTADPLLKKNAEYVKLSSDQAEGKAPREQPSQQTPGGKGYDLPEYGRWTDEELHTLAQDLGLSNHEKMERKELIDALLELQRRRTR